MAARRSWATANSPYWSSHVASWYRGNQDALEYCRRRDLSITTFELWMRHLVSADDLRKRAERLQNLHRKKAARSRKEVPPKRPKRPPRYRYGRRTDSGPIALRAFWSMHVKAMNWSGMGHAEYAAALGLSPHALRIWRNRLEESGDETEWRSLLHPSARAQSSSAANCARRKYRLTPDAVDGRSNRRRFSDNQKRAIVQETEKPGVAVAQVCRRHGVATSMVFRWRVEFGLTARKAPQLATVVLADGAAKELPALGALRDLVQPPDGMVAIELADGRRVFAPGGRQPGWGEAAARRQEEEVMTVAIRAPAQPRSSRFDSRVQCEVQTLVSATDWNRSARTGCGWSIEMERYHLALSPARSHNAPISCLRRRRDSLRPFCVGFSVSTTASFPSSVRVEMSPRCGCRRERCRFARCFCAFVSL
ncbi:transposase [Mesorhizobium sp. M0199]